MHGKKRSAFAIEQNIFRAIAMMHVKIKNGGALGAGRQGFKNGDGDIVQITKAHRLFTRSVMAGRTHEAENIFTAACDLQSVDRGGDGRAGAVGNVFKERGVGIEVWWDFQTGQHGGRMRAEDLRIRDKSRCFAFKGKIGLEPFNRGGDPGGTLGMPEAARNRCIFRQL